MGCNEEEVRGKRGPVVGRHWLGEGRVDTKAKRPAGDVAALAGGMGVCLISKSQKSQIAILEIDI